MRHRTEFLALLIACAGQWPAAAHAAESPVEFLVAASRTDRTVIPGASLRRPADFLLQRVKVSSDAPEAAVRRQEILQTLRLLQDAANRDKAIDLCVLLDNRIVAPMKIDPATMRFGDGPRAQTSEVSIAVKTKVVAGAVGATALFAKLKEFPTTVKPVGRAAVDVVGDVDLTVLEPSQYRAPVIQLYAADVRAVTAALGPEYRVVTRGIDRQLQWLRDGMTDIVIFVPYEYDVIPANVTSYSRTGS